MEMSTTPYRNPAGAITHAVVVSWDVTDREMMAEHLLKLSSAVEQSPVAIIITDTLGDIEYVNPRFVRTTGYALEEVRGRNPRLLKSGETAAGEYRRLWQTITAGEEWRGEFHNRKKNGELFWEFALISPIRNADGQITHFLGVKEDITARKRLERELLEKNKELEQIVYVTSHDLRSPLVNIQGFAKELNRSFLDLRGALGGTQVPADLAEAIGPILEQEIPEAFSYVFASTRKMDALIDGLLRLSRLGRATMMLRPIAMDQLVASIVQTFEYVLQQRGIDVHVEPLPPCLGDEMQINQLFSNLFDNAIKYLDPGRPGRITVSGARTGRVSRYLVADNGIGIDPQHAERIFDIFHRLHPDLVEGEGLGLTIARKIVERHGGTVRVESVPGTGSTFAVTLPAPPSDRSL
jgi:PAS domain S-box-containing protein